MNLITIKNNGPDIESTNYWDTEHAARGFVYLTVNAGAYRLLLPELYLSALVDMMQAKYVVISRGPWPDKGKADALEIMFEDDSDSPYAIHIVPEQCDRLPGNQDTNKERPFTVWARDGETGAKKALELPCWFRMVKRIPLMKGYKR